MTSGINAKFGSLTTRIFGNSSYFGSNAFADAEKTGIQLRNFFTTNPNTDKQNDKLLDITRENGHFGVNV